MTNEAKLDLIKTDPIDQVGQFLKPKGFWYAIGNAWIDWCASEMPDWIHRYFYVFSIKPGSNMLCIDRPQMIHEFSKRYGVNTYYNLREINWIQVNKDYDGIEFNPYFYDQRFAIDSLWYNAIDVPSGVIFNTDIIQNLKRYKTNTIQIIT